MIGRALVGLLLRSAVLRGLLVAAFAAGLGAGMVQSAVAALTPSPEQVATAQLGLADGVIRIAEGSGLPPGRAAQLPPWLAASPQVIVHESLLGSIDLQQGAAYESATYEEANSASPALAGRYELTNGVWGGAPGECVASSLGHGDWSATSGQLTLRITGTVLPVFQPRLRTIVCAPGTWSSWRAEPDGKQQNYEATSQYFVTGDGDRVAEVLDLAVGQGPSVEVLSRRILEQAKAASPAKALGVASLAIAALIALPMIAAMGVMRWLIGVAGVLATCGVNPKLVRRTVLVTAVAAACLAAMMGGVVGDLSAQLFRPQLRGLAGGVPLSPWEMPWLQLVLNSLLAAAAALAGLVSALAMGRLLRRVLTRKSVELGARARLVLSWTGAGTILVAALLIVTSSGYLWTMIGGMLAFAGGSALLSPLVHHWVAKRCVARGIDASGLAGRLILEDGSRWAGVVTGIAIALSFVVGVGINVSASVAAQTALVASPVPAGTVLLGLAGAEGNRLPEATVKQFENDLGLPKAIMMRDLAVGPPGRGLVQTFETEADLVKALGELTPGELAVVRSGGLLVPGGPQTEIVDLVSLSEGKSLSAVTAAGYRPDPRHRLTTGFGFGVDEYLPVEIAGAQTSTLWNVYKGVTEVQDIASRQWPGRTGNNAVTVMAVSGTTSVPPPLWLALSLTGFCALLVPSLLMLMGREIRQLRPLASTLTSLGVSAGWIRQVLRTICFSALGAALATSLISGVASTATLQARYPTVYDIGGVPWALVGLVVVLVLMAAEVACRLAVRRLGHEESRATI